MNILFVAGQIPYPPDQGARIRCFHLLRYLSRQHRVFLLALRQTSDSAEALSELGKYCTEIVCVDHDRNVFDKIVDLLRSTFGALPYTVLANTNKKLQAVLADTIRTFAIDVVQLEELYIAKNIDGLHLSCPMVLDAPNREGEILVRLSETAKHPWQRMFAKFQCAKMENFERQILQKVDCVFGVSEKDCEYFRQHAKRVELIPNGASEPDAPETPRENDILFCGSLDYTPNQDAVEYFLDDIWPKIEAASAELRLIVVGRRPPRRLLRRAGKRVKIFADVADVKPYFRSASMLVVPLRAGGGTRLKILEAFEHNLPVVSTSIGAEGLSVVDGLHLLLRDQPDDFAGAVLELSQDSAKARKLAASAAQLLRQRYLWENISRDCERAYQFLRQ